MIENKSEQKRGLVLLGMLFNVALAILDTLVVIESALTTPQIATDLDSK